MMEFWKRVLIDTILLLPLLVYLPEQGCFISQVLGLHHWQALC